ncbi:MULTISPECIES: hypothetical protein [Lysinibacillus]|uniref:hypothetical protein n=1 Tax=Lysinibacillus TaxID=400634 RepID=UPI00257D7F4C|nr:MULTISPECIES: hypothetical protein [Lysinibacillus]
MYRKHCGQKSSTSISGEMNDNLSYYSVDVHTPAEIEGLSLRTPCPVAKRRQYGFNCAKAKRQQQQHTTE